MKKFFYFAMIALVSVAFASCKPNDPVKKGPITLVVSNVETTTASFSCTPDDVKKPYLFTYYEKAAYDTLTFDQITAEQVEAMDFYIEFLAMITGETYTYADFASVGVFEDELEGLTPNTKYVAIAYYIDVETGKPVSEESITTFQTKAVKEVGKVDVKFSETEWYDFVADQGWWQLMAYSEDKKYYVSLSPVQCSKVEGTYTLDDMDTEYTVLVDVENDEEVIAFADFKLTVTKEKDMYVFKANGLGVNGYRYNMTFEPVDPASAIQQAPARYGNKAAKKNFRSNEQKVGFLGQKLLKK